MYSDASHFHLKPNAHGNGSINIVFLLHLLVIRRAQMLVWGRFRSRRLLIDPGGPFTRCPRRRLPTLILALESHPIA